MARGYSGAGAGFLNPAGFAAGAIGSLDELGDWWQYSLPGGVLPDSAGQDMTSWTDASPNARPLLPMFGSPAVSGPIVDKTTLASGTSIMDCATRHQLGSHLLTVGEMSDTDTTWTQGTMFIAFKADTVSADYVVGFWSDVSSRGLVFRLADAGGGQLSWNLYIDRPFPDTASTFSQYEPTDVAGNLLDLNSWHTLWAVCDATTVRLYLDGNPVPATYTDSGSGQVEGSWIGGAQGFGREMRRWNVGARLQGVNYAFGHEGPIGAAGVMGGNTSASALSAADVKLGDNFIRSLFV